MKIRQKAKKRSKLSDCLDIDEKNRIKEVIL